MKNSADLGGYYVLKEVGRFTLCLLTKNNTTLFPVFLGPRFNVTKLLTSFVQFDKVPYKFGQKQLVMVNYACGFNQSETGKHFE